MIEWLWKSLFLGHPFVRRFENFVSNSSDHWVTPNLNLNSEEVQIFYAGYGEASLSRIRAQSTDYVRHLCPDVVILQAVTNDLCRRNKAVDDINRELLNLLSIFVMQKMWRRWLYFRHYIEYLRLVVLGLQWIQSGSTSEWMNS